MAHAAGCHLDPRSDARPVGEGSLEFHLQPVLAGHGLVAEQLVGLTRVGKVEVEVTVVIEVPPCHALATPGVVQGAAGGVGKRATAVVPEQLVC